MLTRIVSKGGLRRLQVLLASSFLAFGVYLYLTDHHAASIGPFALAGVGFIARGVFLLPERILNRGRAQMQLALADEPSVVFERLVTALHQLPAEAEPVLDDESMTASVVLPRTAKSFGEEVIGQVTEVEAGALLDIWSRCVHPQLLDYGKNRANIDHVIRLVLLQDALHDEAPGSPI